MYVYTCIYSDDDEVYVYMNICIYIYICIYTYITLPPKLNFRLIIGRHE